MYNLFTKLHLRHLLVLPRVSEPLVGVITRKDILPETVAARQHAAQEEDLWYVPSGRGHEMNGRPEGLEPEVLYSAGFPEEDKWELVGQVGRGHSAVAM